MAVLLIGKNFVEGTDDSRECIYKTPKNLKNLLYYHYTNAQFIITSPELYEPYNYNSQADIIFDQFMYYQNCCNKNLYTRALHYILLFRMDEKYHGNAACKTEAEIAMTFYKICGDLRYLLCGNILPGHQRMFFFYHDFTLMRIDIIANPVHIDSLDVCTTEAGFRIFLDQLKDVTDQNSYMIIGQ